MCSWGWFFCCWYIMLYILDKGTAACTIVWLNLFC